MIMEYKGIMPEISSEAFVAPSADIIGDVKIAADASVWFGAVIRGDEAPISIGEGTNIQDNCVLHCDHGSPMVIGKNVTIGHGSIVHGATIGDNVLIGMG
ncbi:MAG: gamma carbonic anhydrase family protein, partial [Oscillospiraceae bacterium]|nr:gamma carbonic anhydrase family protein [Oscillospiraceae bacterium]